MLGRRHCALISIAMGLALGGCSTTLNDQDCARYRDKLVAWAAQKGVDKKEEADEFMKSCPGTVISRRTKKCLENAADDAEFQKCLE
jgi:hypothetical protein